MLGIFVGTQNSGKTLSMTYYGYKYFKSGYKIYSNYNLEFKHIKVTKEMLEDFTRDRIQFNKAVFLIDELYLILDARSFGKKFNKLFSYFILQTSKRDVHLLGTAQYFNTVEKRFRENTDFINYCSRVIKHNNNYYIVTDKLRFLKNNDDLYIKNTFVVRTALDGLFPQTTTRVYYLKAKPLFKMYDTKQILAIE